MLGAADDAPGATEGPRVDLQTIADRPARELLSAPMKRTTAQLLWVVLLASCGGGGDTSVPAAAMPPPASVVPPPASVVADITVLMMGNSHTSVNQLPDTLATMLRAGNPGKTVTVTVAPGSMFLDERLAHGPSVALLRGQRWSHVVLQAQKYSTSGTRSYSTAEAEQLIRLARTSGAVPVMFPEWARLGIGETETIYDLHVSIAFAEPACVAPIGQAWDRALTRHPTLTLHSADGNHSAPAGAFLAALVLYSTLTGSSPAALPTFAGHSVDDATQAQLRRAAADTVEAVAPRRMCPKDPF